MGDFVDFDMNDDGTGVIFNVHKRLNYLSRKAPKIKGASYRGERLEQVIASNIDNVFIVTSVLEPDFNNKTIDRFLVACESSNLKVFIIINKIDLVEKDFTDNWANLYRSIGYEVLETSVKENLGIEKINQFLIGKKNLFWGQSGVGKSSILNSLYPGLKLKIGEVSSYSQKGVHTTVTSTMFKQENDTYIIDTPGVREIDPYGIQKEFLSHYFPEFENYFIKCKFNTCTHQHEPDCAVIEAVENDNISVERYDSYLRILESIEEDLHF